MNGAKLRERLARGEAVTMFNTHHMSSGLAVRLVELGGDSVFVDCEHGTWSFEDVRVVSHAVRAAGGAAIVRPQSHERPLMIRYLNAGADGLMVPMVETADQARAIVEAVRYACPADHEKRLVIAMIETPAAIGNLDTLLKVDGVDVFFIGPGDLSQNMGYPPAPPAKRWMRSARPGRSLAPWSPRTNCRSGGAAACSSSTCIPIRSCGWDCIRSGSSWQCERRMQYRQKRSGARRQVELRRAVAPSG
jgi:2-keto-3-deoxy-L-rhamnonate aldolase RhmA